MIAYFDTSAIVPLLVAGPSTALCTRVWTDAERRVASRLALVEAAAALAMAERRSRLTRAQHDQARALLDHLWTSVDAVEVTAEVVATAASIARSQALRGYDAVHCASALSLAGPDLVAVTGDVHLRDAWTSLGVPVVHTGGAPSGLPDAPGGPPARW